MSIILNIETALSTAFVSISRDGSMLQHLTNTLQKEHASFLHPAIKEILKNTKLQTRDIDAIAVSGGPGSYTGLRVGFAAAKGLCYALGKPLICISTLAVMAQAAQLAMREETGYLYCPMIDARRTEVFTALYSAVGVEIFPPYAMLLDNSSFTAELQSNKILFSGSGAIKFQKICTHENAHFAHIESSVEAMNILSVQKFRQKEFADTVNSTPLYVKEFYVG